MLCICSSHCPLSGYHDAGCCGKTICDCWCHLPAEPSASVMPPNVKAIDPAFLSALSEPIPEEAMREKAER